jgi:prepilin-type N-terminal cleavage/methylation domain-containing protein
MGTQSPLKVTANESSPDLEPRLHERRTKAFSLVELLVTLAVISVLAGVLIPAVASARREAERVAMLVNQREAMRVVDLYTNDHDLAYPCFGEPGTMASTIRWRGEDRPLGWWSQPEYWGWFVGSLGYDGHLSQGATSELEAASGSGGCAGCGFDRRSIHWLSAALFAEPDLFVEGAVVDKASHRGVLAHETLLPADKAIVYQVYFPIPSGGDGPARRPVHFADGHGEQRRADELTLGPANHLPYFGLPTMNTPGGIHGSDRAAAR